MCGIFGLIRNTQARHPERATAAFVELGRKAVERGRDAAGFALINPAETTNQATTPTRAHVEAKHTVIDNVTIFKDVVSFDALWDDSKHLAPLAAHRVALGHTRWATQGKKDALTNASPLLAGSLVGTHNGDVDTRSVQGHYSLPRPMGSTDTEVLYNALARDRRDRRKVTEVLRNVEGRAALAWVDRGRTERVYLARAALSPMAIAFDVEGNMYWASNPRWFRSIDEHFGGAIGFHTITLVEEGALLTVSLNEAAPVVEDQRRFTPLCRPSDARLSDGVVWRGFDAPDREADKTQKRHKVAPARYSGWGKPTRKNSTARTLASSLDSHDSNWWNQTPTARDPFDVPVKSAAESAAVLRDIPAYDDTLADLVGTRFANSTSQTEDRHAEQSGLWDAEDEELAQEEAMRAANQWVYDGGDPTILNVVRGATMPSEIEGLLDEFDLTSVGAFEQFRHILSEWADEMSAC